MKITWFGGSVFRLHIGGAIIVTDAALAPEQIDAQELASGADQLVALDGASGEALPEFDREGWVPQRPRRLIDEADAAPEIRVWRLGEGGLFVEAGEDGPLIIARASGTVWSRFADSAVVVLVGKGHAMAGAVQALSGAARPRLIAIASELAEAEFAALASALRGASAQVMEPGLALEA